MTFPFKIVPKIQRVRKMPVQKYIFYYVQFVNKICILKWGYFQHLFDT